MLSRIGLSSRRARSSASGPHGYQSTGWWACWSRYGLVSRARRLRPSCGIWLELYRFRRPPNIAELARVSRDASRAFDAPRSALESARRRDGADVARRGHEWDMGYRRIL